MDTWWVYENWTNEYGRIHKATCSHCNDGYGKTGQRVSPNGQWHSPYHDRNAALNALLYLPYETLDTCYFCYDDRWRGWWYEARRSALHYLTPLIRWSYRLWQSGALDDLGRFLK